MYYCLHMYIHVLCMYHRGDSYQVSADGYSEGTAISSEQVGLMNSRDSLQVSNQKERSVKKM